MKDGVTRYLLIFGVLLVLVAAGLTVYLLTVEKPAALAGQTYPQNSCQDYLCIARAAQECTKRNAVEYSPARQNGQIEQYVFGGWQSGSCTITRSLRSSSQTTTATCTLRAQEMTDISSLTQNIAQGRCFT